MRVGVGGVNLIYGVILVKGRRKIVLRRGLLEQVVFFPLIFIMIALVETRCSDLSPQGVTLKSQLGAGSTTQLPPIGIQRLKQFSITRPLTQSWRGVLETDPSLPPTLFDGQCWIVKGLVQYHAPFQALLEPFQRDNLHPPVQGMFVLVARGRCGDKMGDDLGEVAVILCAVLIDSLLDVFPLLRCASSAPVTQGLFVEVEVSYGCRSR
jgi:hypothetical protein